MYDSEIPQGPHRGTRPRVSASPNAQESRLFASTDPDWIGGEAGCLETSHLHAPREREPHEPRETPTEAAVRVSEALRVCDSCPMLSECREWAFRTRPTGVVVAGMDLSPARSEFPDAADEVDHDILMGRVSRIAQDLGVALTDYQRRFMSEVLAGREPAWQHGGGRKGHREQVYAIFAHPDLGLQRDRAVS